MIFEFLVMDKNISLKAKVEFLEKVTRRMDANYELLLNNFDQLKAEKLLGEIDE